MLNKNMQLIATNNRRQDRELMGSIISALTRDFTHKIIAIHQVRVVSPKTNEFGEEPPADDNTAISVINNKECCWK
jgi:hypothetical protein